MCDLCAEGWGLPTCAVCDESHVGEKCDVDCVSAHAQYRDLRDGAWGREPVVPLVSCVFSSNGDVFGWLGYDNKNPHNVYLDIGADNRLTRPYLEIVPGGDVGFVRKSSDNVSANLIPLPTEDYGQPTKFTPGKHEKVFKIK